MMKVDFYSSSYRFRNESPYTGIRREVYGEDLGQTGWMTADELRLFGSIIGLNGEHQLLEIGSGAGGCALALARRFGCTVTGIDKCSVELAALQEADPRVTLLRHDAESDFTFLTDRFHRIFSNDTICHIQDRYKFLKRCYEALAVGGKMLITDPVVVVGAITSRELAKRSLIGDYCFTPQGENDHMFREAGFSVLDVVDCTPSMANIARRWHQARQAFKGALADYESVEQFEGVQDFLEHVATLAADRKLARYAYLVERSR